MAEETYNANLVGASKGRAGGYAYVAPAGTDLPTTDELSSDYKPLGYITEDGITESSEVESNDVKDWGGNLIKRELTSYSRTLSTTFLEAREDVLKVIFGDDNVTVSGDTIQVNINGDFMKYEHVFVFDYYVGDDYIGRTVIPRGVVSEQSDLQHSATDTTPFECTITELADTNGNTSYYSQYKPA